MLKNISLESLRRHWLEALALTLILAAYFALVLPNLDLPGLHPDEAQEVIPAVQLLRGQAVETLRGSGLTLLGRRWPVMIVDYIGTANTYLALPFFAVFGISVTTLRAVSVLISAVTLVLLYRFGRALYGPRVGLAAAVLLAVQPTFIFWSRQGVFVTFVTAPLMLGAALCGWRWWREGSIRALYAGAYLTGLALAAKLLSVWVLVGVGGAFVMLYASQVWQALRARTLEPFGLSLSWREVGFAALFFVLGLGMLILYNVQTGGTWQAITENLGTSYYGVNNLAIGENLVERFIGLKVVLTGEHFWYLGGSFLNPWWPRALQVCAAAALGLTLWRERAAWRRVAFPLLVLALMTAASIFTVSALWYTHFAVITPWPALALAVSLDALARHVPRRVGLALAGVVLVALVALDVQVDRKYHAALAATGGLHAHSAAVYRLAERLQDEGNLRPFALDWGIQDPVQFLTRGDINPVELTGFDFELDPGFELRVLDSLETKDGYYVFHVPEQTIFERRAAFEEIIAAEGWQIADEELIYDFSGQPIFALVWLEQVAP